MSIRLTESMRAIILSRILKHTFGAREEAIEKEKPILAMQVYEDAYTKTGRELMANAPKDYFRENDEISFYLEGRYKQLPLGKTLRFPHDGMPRFADTGLTGRTLADHFKAESDLEKEVEDKSFRIRIALKKFTTLKALREGWPEVESFTKGFDDKPKVCTAIMVPLQALNRELGLPPDVKEPAAAPAAA